MSGFKSDHNLVRDYVVAQDHLQYSQLPEDVVCIHMSHSNLPAKHLDIRLNLHMTVSNNIIISFKKTRSEARKTLIKFDISIFMFCIRVEDPFFKKKE